jgi:hypothetical protein
MSTSHPWIIVTIDLTISIAHLKVSNNLLPFRICSTNRRAPVYQAFCLIKVDRIFNIRRDD